MGLETATFISGLVATNPVGATDPKSAGDDHLRLIKATILATFAAITGAVTASHTELNNLTGVTGKTGSGNVVLSASPTLTGTVTAGTINASSLGTSPLNASNLSSGTVPDARFPATLPAASGANLTALNASNIASGSLADARLSANVPLINATNTFTIGQVIDAASASNSYLRYKVGGVDKGFVALGDGVGGTAGNLTVRAEAGLDLMSNGANIRLAINSSGNFDFKSGTVTTSNTTADQVGYKGAPSKSWNSSSDNPVLADAGKSFDIASSGALTIPANGTVAFPIGTILVFISRASGVTIAITSDTLYLAGTGFGTTGTRNLASGGMATAIKITATAWMISGQGLS